jgi:nucleoside-diphosphate-sugar epimerase
VDDLVDGIIKLMASDVVSPVNLGNPTEITILDLAKTVIEITDSNSPITFIIPDDERTRDDPKKRCPDIRLARTKLGWNPNVSLREGIKSTTAYFRVKEGL